MKSGWLHTLTSTVYNPRFDELSRVELDVVWGNQKLPVMFYTDEATAVVGPSEIPSAWELVIAE